MDQNSNVKKEIDSSLAHRPRKGGLKLAPKKLQRKPAKVIPKTFHGVKLKVSLLRGAKDEAVDKELLLKLKTSQSTDPFERRLKTEKKEEIQTHVAFGQGDSSCARSFPARHYSAVPKAPKEYVDPWDYTHSDYPVTLPLRRPYSGDPEILDEEEFGENSASRAEDGEITAAEELGLMVVSFVKKSSVDEPNAGSEENAEPAGTTPKVVREQTRPTTSFQGSKIKDLPGGLMGKILVYKSGKVKMKIGDALFNVSWLKLYVRP